MMKKLITPSETDVAAYAISGLDYWCPGGVKYRAAYAAKLAVLIIISCQTDNISWPFSETSVKTQNEIRLKMF